MPVPSVALASEQLAAIRAEIDAHGSATIDCAELEALCSDQLSVADQFVRIGEIARAEGWDVDFAGDAVVRFFSPINARQVRLVN